MSRKYGQGLVPYAFRIEPEIKEQLAKMVNANEFIRDAIREKLAREDAANEAAQREADNQTLSNEVYQC